MLEGCTWILAKSEGGEKQSGMLALLHLLLQLLSMLHYSAAAAAADAGMEYSLSINVSLELLYLPFTEICKLHSPSRQSWVLVNLQ